MPQAVPDPDPKSLTDPELARRVAGGDIAAFRLLMRRHNQTLYRTARSILRDDAEAEDAVQEAYLLAYRAMAGFRGDAKLSTWLVRIVVNEALGRRRKAARSAEIFRLDGDSGSAAESAEVNMNDATPEQPEQEAMRAQTRRLLEKKVDELPDAFRAVFVLRAIEEMSVEETAAALALPEATVRSRLFRARGLLRESLAREIDFAFEDAFSFAGDRCDRIVAGVLARLGDPKPPA
ncbi:MAG: RNA polymerase sigma factor [Proteobacteria bacterium]|nr:RNA polymerase sigma factor [Pseudomonadota bacterium]